MMSDMAILRQPRLVPVLRHADLHRANLARGSAEVGQARPFTIRFEDHRPELTIDISLRPRSSLRRSTRAREDRLRGGDRVGLLGPGAAELWLQRCSRTIPGLSGFGKR